MHRCGPGPTETSCVLDSRRHWEPHHHPRQGPLTFHGTETKILRNLTLQVPHQMKRRGAPLLFGRETQRQPHLDSKVWADGRHPAAEQLQLSGPTLGPALHPALQGSRFSHWRMSRALPGCGLDAGKLCQQCHREEAKRCHLQGTAAMWVMAEGAAL